MSGTETLYMLDRSSMATPEAMAADAERRARERGCECPAAEFVHVFGGHPIADVLTVVRHTSPACPLRGES